MTAREKLARLLWKAHNAVTEAELKNDDMSYADALGIEADVLIAHGVVISKMETTTQKWIPVSEMLPEHGDVVLCRFCHMAHPQVCQWDARAEFWIGRTSDFGKKLVTHWMPLPSLPKEE